MQEIENEIGSSYHKQLFIIFLTCLMITAAFKTSSLTFSKQQPGVCLWYETFWRNASINHYCWNLFSSTSGLWALRHSIIICSFTQAIVALKHKGGHSFPSYTWWRLSHIKKCLVPNLINTSNSQKGAHTTETCFILPACGQQLCELCQAILWPNNHSSVSS